MKPIKFILVILVIVSFGCNQDDIVPQFCETGSIVTQNHSFDTIYPSDFIMAYPGSWWEYSDGSIDSCLYWESMFLRTSSDSANCTLVDEDIVIVPEKLNYHFGNIFGDQEFYTTQFSSVFKPILDTVVGVFYTSSSTSGHMRTIYSRETLDRLPSFEVNGVIYFDILKVEHRTEYQGIGISSPPDHVAELYFAKNVGLIKQRTLAWMEWSEKELVDYYIAPH